MTGAVAPPDRVEIDRADLGIESNKLGNLSLRDFGIRFAFGAGVSLLAGLVGLGVGQRAGGVLLAFPAILPAALTLIEKREGTSEAVADIRGAVIGACAMVFFAVTVVALAGRMPTALAILVAGVGWGVAGTVFFFGGNLLARGLHEQQYLPEVGVIEAEPVVEALRRAGMSVAVAETESGGALAALLASAEGGPQVVRGGVVVVNPEGRRRLLGLDLAAPEGEELALAMAGAARTHLGADVGLVIAGPAESGPDPGLTWVVAAGPRRTRVAKLVGDRGPEENRGDAVRAALRLCREVVEDR
jgi:nicotinamide mononucleotide (NMN) deamidase PncC